MRGSEWVEHIRNTHAANDCASFGDFRLFAIDHFQKRRWKSPARSSCLLTERVMECREIHHSRAGQQQKIQITSVPRPASGTLEGQQLLEDELCQFVMLYGR